MPKHMAHESNGAEAVSQKRRRRPASLSVKTSSGASAASISMGHAHETQIGTDFSRRTFRRNATLFDDHRSSDPMRARETAAAVRHLQMTFGNRYVQRLVEESSRNRTTVEGGASGDGYAQEGFLVADSPKLAAEPTTLHGEDERAQVLSREFLEGTSDVVQRDFKDKLRKLFGSKNKSDLTPEEEAELDVELAKLEQEEEGPIEEAEVEEVVEELTEEEDKELDVELAELMGELDREEAEETNEEEMDAELEELEADILEEVVMSPEELKEALKQARSIAESLTRRYKRLIRNTKKLSSQYRKLMKKGKYDKAEQVYKRFMETPAELRSANDAAFAAWDRVTELQKRKSVQIGDALARPIDPDTDVDEDLVKLEEVLEKESEEHEERKSTAMDELDEQPPESIEEPVEQTELEAIDAPTEEPEEEEKRTPMLA